MCYLCANKKKGEKAHGRNDQRNCREGRVSRGTVDRALNNRGRVNPEVAERIFEIAREMNYQPKRKKKYIIKERRSGLVSLPS